MRTYCAICGSRIDPRPVEGTDPADADESWYEVYECRSGHEGRLEVEEPTESNGWKRTERRTGAIREEAERVVV